jgi:hypothetical protein
VSGVCLIFKFLISGAVSDEETEKTSMIQTSAFPQVNDNKKLLFL